MKSESEIFPSEFGKPFLAITQINIIPDWNTCSYLHTVIVARMMKIMKTMKIMMMTKMTMVGMMIPDGGKGAGEVEGWDFQQESAPYYHRYDYCAVIMIMMIMMIIFMFIIFYNSIPTASA